MNDTYVDAGTATCGFDIGGYGPDLQVIINANITDNNNNFEYNKIYYTP